MRVVIGSLLAAWSLWLMADQQIIAQAVDDEVPDVNLQLPEEEERPLIETYHTEFGQLAAVVTPEQGDSYTVIPADRAYQTQFPQGREADVPVNNSNWTLISW